MVKSLRFGRSGWIKLTVLAICCLIVVVYGCGKSTTSVQPPSDEAGKAISLGTSSVGSAFYTLSVGMANIISKHTGLSVTAEPVGGSDATLRGLRERKVDIGMVNADSAVNAYYGKGQYTQEGRVAIRLIAQGQESLRQIVARADANIKTPADLVGKRFIARRKALPEVEAIANALFEVYGIPGDKVKILETAETNEAIEALKVGTADAAIIPGGVPASFLTDLAQSTRVTFLSIPEDKLSAIIAKLGPAFHRASIPPDTYPGQSEEIKVPAMSTVLVAHADLSEETVYQVTKALLSNTEELKAVHSAGKYWTIERTLQDFPLPFHPGAVRYFEETGQWTEEMARRQSQLMQ